MILYPFYYSVRTAALYLYSSSALADYLLQQFSLWVSTTPSFFILFYYSISISISISPCENSTHPMPNPSVSWFQSSGSSTRSNSNSSSNKIIQRLIVRLLGIFAKPLVVFILVVWILPAAISWGHYWNWLTANQCVLVSYHHHNHPHPSGGVAVERYCHGLSSSSSSTTKSSKNTYYYYASSSIMHQVPTLLELSDFLSASTSRTTTTTTTTTTTASNTKAAPMLGTRNDVGILIEWDGTGWKSSSTTDEAKKITTLERTTATATATANTANTNTAGTRTTTNPLATSSSSASRSSSSSIINFAPPAPILEEKEETSEKKKKDDSAQTAYGFRRNDHQRQNGNHNARRGRPRPFIPVTTGILLAINLGMFLWLWNNNSNSNSSNNTIGRVAVVPMMDPCPRDVVVVVSLNQDVYHDFGRSITGHLSHFEAWHIGFNMMTLSALGPSLEEYYGSLPLLLWTISFLPITTLVVLGLFHLLRRSPPTRRLCGCCSSSSSSSSSSTTTTTTTTATADSTSIISPSFPSMVGFSGILFAWMVVSTLLNDGQRSCPVIFLPNLCFDTFELLLPGGGDGNANAVRVSWAPLVQLVVLQVILPRVSFLGHLAGIVVGFLWHWRIFPSLEWMQPCILFPVLWMGGKYYYYHCYYHYHWYYFQTSPFPTSGETTTTSTATPIITGSSSSSSSSRSSNARGKSRRLSDDFPATLRQLTLLRNILVVHWIFQLQQLGLHCFFSGTVAELLLIVILFGLIHIGRKQQQQSCKEEYEQKQQKQQQQQQQERNEQLLLLFGVVGRGYIFLVLVMMVTDGLTLGAWLATWSLWANSLMASLLLLSRNMVFLLSISLTVHALVIVGDAAEACCSSSTTSTSTASTSTTSRGGSFGILLWPLVRQMQPLGKWLEQQQRRSGIQQFVVVVIAGSLCRLLGAEFRGRTSTPATEHPPEGGSRTEEAVHYDHSSATTTSELV